MKILTIVNDEEPEQLPALFEELQAQSEVEVVRLTEQSLSYDELVDKIEQCDKVLSW